MYNLNIELEDIKIYANCIPQHFFKNYKQGIYTNTLTADNISQIKHIILQKIFGYSIYFNEYLSLRQNIDLNKIINSNGLDWGFIKNINNISYHPKLLKIRIPRTKYTDIMMTNLAVCPTYISYPYYEYVFATKELFLTARDIVEKRVLCAKYVNSLIQEIVEGQK